MEKTKFTVRVDAEALDRARGYAARNNTTLTRLVNEFLRYLGKSLVTEAPILEQMAGTLQPETSLEDYYHYLEDKYLGVEKPNARPD